MSAASKVKASAARLGVTPWDGDAFVIIDAPLGQCWAANGEHTFTASADEGRGLMWEDLLEVLSMGLEPCSPINAPHCPFCSGDEGAEYRFDRSEVTA
jgi:hypothetical protein